MTKAKITVLVILGITLSLFLLTKPSTLIKSGPSTYNQLSQIKGLNDSLCITWVKDKSPEQILELFHGIKPYDKAFIKDIDHISYVNVKPALIVGQTPNNWSFAIEPKSNFGSSNHQLLTLSKGTEAISLYWDSDGHSAIEIAQDEKLIAKISDVSSYVNPYGDNDLKNSLNGIEGAKPTIMHTLIKALHQVQDYDWETSAFDWLSNNYDLDVSDDWLKQKYNYALIDEDSLTNAE